MALCHHFWSLSQARFGALLAQTHGQWDSIVPVYCSVLYHTGIWVYPGFHEKHCTVHSMHDPGFAELLQCAFLTCNSVQNVHKLYTISNCSTVW